MKHVINHSLDSLPDCTAEYGRLPIVERTIKKAPAIGFARYIISATTLFRRDDLFDLRADAPSVLKRTVPDYEAEYAC